MARFFSWLFSFSSLLLTLLKSLKSIGFFFYRTIAKNSSNNYDFSFKKWRRQINRHINVYYNFVFHLISRYFLLSNSILLGSNDGFCTEFLSFIDIFIEFGKTNKKLFESSKTIIYYISFNFILIHTPVYAVYSNANAFMLKQYVRLQHFVARFFFFLFIRYFFKTDMIQ